MKIVIGLFITWLVLIPVTYSGCMGYWNHKYPNHNDVWEDRGFCTMVALLPPGQMAVFFAMEFYHYGFSY